MKYIKLNDGNNFLEKSLTSWDKIKFNIPNRLPYVHFCN